MASIFAVPFLSVLVLLAASRVAMAADIDCHAVKTPLTEIICDDAELLQLDSRMADRLAAAMDAAGNDRAALAREQRGWLGSRAAACPPGGPQTATGCLALMYRARIGQLEARTPTAAVDPRDQARDRTCAIVARRLNGEKVPKGDRLVLSFDDLDPTPAPLDDSGESHQAASLVLEGHRIKVVKSTGHGTCFDVALSIRSQDLKRQLATPKPAPEEFYGWSDDDGSSGGCGSSWGREWPVIVDASGSPAADDPLNRAISNALGDT